MLIFMLRAGRERMLWQPGISALEYCVESRPAHINHDEVVLKEKLKCRSGVAQCDKAPKQRHC